MSSIVRLLLLLGLLPLAVPSLGAAGEAPSSQSLFPLVMGATWVRRNDDGIEATSRVVGSKTVGGRQCMVIERRAVERGRERVARTCYLATATEVLILESTTPRGEVRVTVPPRTVLKLPPRAGVSWTWSMQDATFDLKVTEKWIGQETVKVPSGTYRAWKLQTSSVGEDLEVTTYTWYAAGVGVVRTERKGRRGDQQFSGWSELVTYKAP